MESKKIVKIAFWVSPYLFGILKNATNLYEKMREVFSSLDNPEGRFLLDLEKYLKKQTEKFDGTELTVFYNKNYGNMNLFLRDVALLVNQSVFDIVARGVGMREDFQDRVNFIYPIRLSSFTFLTYKPEYEPQIFGIFQTFSSTLWIAIASVFISMVCLCYIAFKRKYTFRESFFHVLAVLMKQSAIIKPSSYAENIIVYSWVLGAMFLCLAYDSVFLSFLSFPPVTQIKHLSDLAAAVENGEFHCIADPFNNLKSLFLDTNHTYLKIIGLDLQTNNLSTHAYKNFFYFYNQGKFAYLENVSKLGFFGGKYFISEDRFFEWMPAMMVTKRFCCKNVLDTFVHKMMASGIYFKYHSDAEFMFLLKWLHFSTDNDTTRKLTLTDVAPAFIFLLCGYFLSFLVFIIEIFKKREITRNISRKKIIQNKPEEN